ELLEEIEQHTAGLAAKPNEPQETAATFEPSQLLDRAALLERVEGHRTLLAELVELFLGDYPRLLAGVRDAAARGDAKALMRAAHTVRSTLGRFAAPAATAAALQLEEIGRRGELTRVAEACAALEKEIERLKPLLAEFRQEVSR
ncbi:MAG TPA: Hpt domain-containing protein, partial [Candidatus Acidoferrales bacterium]|nr:Hpt domain-containing protein [Candidatus Acidoferrales bacterium]